jgi:hypothetical protein
MFGRLTKAQREMLEAIHAERAAGYAQWLASRTVCSVEGCDDLESEIGSVGGYCGFHDTWVVR